MIDLSKRPFGCFEPDSDPDSSTGGFLEPDSGLAGQSGAENRAGRARAGRRDRASGGADGVGLGAGVSNDAGRDVGGGGMSGCRAEAGGRATRPAQGPARRIGRGGDVDG